MVELEPQLIQKLKHLGVVGPFHLRDANRVSSDNAAADRRGAGESDLADQDFAHVKAAASEFRVGADHVPEIVLNDGVCARDNHPELALRAQLPQAKGQRALVNNLVATSNPPAIAAGAKAVRVSRVKDALKATRARGIPKK